MVFLFEDISKIEKKYSTFRADRILFDEEHLSIKIPDTDQKGRIPTLNKTGFMCTDLDPITLAFIEESQKSKSPVLEVGAAYGAASKDLLANGSIVVANDMDIRHLLILRERVDKKNWINLYLNNQRFPDETNFPENTFSSVLLCRITHFLNANTMDMVFKKIYRWLKPQGQLFFVNISPFHPRLSWFLPVYEERWKNGVLWPGEITDIKNTWPTMPLAENIPQFLHVMDERPFRNAIEKMNFKIKHLELFCHNGIESEARHKDYLGAVVIKQ